MKIWKIFFFQFLGMIFIIDSIWDVLARLESSRNRKYISIYQQKQHALDRERSIHGVGLYAIWNLKIYMINEVARLNPYKSEFFLFTDAGAWRFQQFEKWPDVQFTRLLASRLDNRILFGQVAEYDARKYGAEKDIIQGKIVYFFPVIYVDF